MLRDIQAPSNVGISFFLMTLNIKSFQHTISFKVLKKFGFSKEQALILLNSHFTTFCWIVPSAEVSNIRIFNLVTKLDF